MAKKLRKNIKKKKQVKKAKPYTRLTKAEYAKALQHPKWQRKRLRVFNRDNWKCTRCRDTETTLHVHHKEYTKKYPYNELMKNLVTLCSVCHRKTHNK